MGTKRAFGNKKQKESFEKRYGMTRSQWAEYKKTNPKEAQVLRLKAYKLIK